MRFDMTGTLSIPKKTDNFSPYSENHYDSGWVNRQLLFNATCGDNRHMLSVRGGCFEDEHNDVYVFTKATTDDDGKTVKGEPLRIPFKERLTSPRLPEVAEFKKFIIDLEKPGRRYKLEKAAEKIKEGKSLTDDELNELGIESEDTVPAELKKSQKRRHEYISEWDYAEFIKKVLDSDKYKDKKFLIRGEYDRQYSDVKQSVYESYVPNRIYLAADDAEVESTATLNMLFTKDAVDDMSVEEKGKYYVNGYTMEYDSARKKNIPLPITIVIPAAAEDADDKTKKRVDRIVQKFSAEDDEVREYGVIVNMLDGAQKTEITEDMLTDEQKDDLECGLITMDDIRAEYGKDVYGDRIRELQFVKPARGFTKGSNETAYSVEDLEIPPLEEENDDVEDLFDEDDEL